MAAKCTVGKLRPTIERATKLLAGLGTPCSPSPYVEVPSTTISDASTAIKVAWTGTVAIPMNRSRGDLNH
jgi:hypothetical protein